MVEEYIVFTGRPNAGKSSLIKVVSGLKVPVGKDPGTTTRIESYGIAKDLVLVDMPGYGRSLRAGRDIEERTKDAILGFLRDNAGATLLAVHVVNTSTFLETTARLNRKGFIPVDVEMVHYMKRDLGIPVLVAANKMDQASEPDAEENLEALKDEVGPGIPVYPVSARTGFGVGALKEEIRRRLVDRGHRNPFELVR